MSVFAVWYLVNNCWLKFQNVENDNAMRWAAFQYDWIAPKMITTKNIVIGAENNILPVQVT